MKFAFVTPRYGADIPSGPEHACRLLAEQLCERHDVEVLTSCARDSRSWKNEYSEGADRVRGVLVRRFPVSQPHDPAAFRQLSERLFTSPRSRQEELEWVRRLGPVTPGLIDHLKRQHRAYDVVVFFSLWHATTVHGMPAAADRAVLFPYVQLRPALRFALWPELVSSARAIGLMSGAERTLLDRYLCVKRPHEELVGIGVDPPPQQAYPRHQQDPADVVTADDDASAPEPSPGAYLEGRGVPFRRRHRLYGGFALYGGRVEADNGCEEMLEYFHSYAESDEAETGLVLMGVKMMRLWEDTNVRMAGVLPDRERMVAYEAADVTLAPSPDDLLAQTLLESLAVGTPVLASARNESAVEHCRRANAGLFYADRAEFTAALRLLMADTRLRETLGENGRAYVRQHFRWEPVLGRFERLISRVRPR